MFRGLFFFLFFHLLFALFFVAQGGRLFGFSAFVWLLWLLRGFMRLLWLLASVKYEHFVRQCCKLLHFTSQGGKQPPPPPLPKKEKNRTKVRSRP